MGYAVLLGLGVLAGVWFVLRGAPLVDEARCQRRELLDRGECRGPCRQGRLPCTQEPPQ